VFHLSKLFRYCPVKPPLRDHELCSTIVLLFGVLLDKIQKISTLKSTFKLAWQFHVHCLPLYLLTFPPRHNIKNNAAHLSVLHVGATLVILDIELYSS